MIWLTENDYITVTYGLHRTGTEDLNILNHIKHPLIFLGKQIGILIPFFIMLLFLKPKFKIKSIWKDNRLSFLLAINILPIVLMFLTSMIMGVKIRTMWMTPFYLFFGTLAIYIFQSKINFKKLKNFFILFTIIFIFSPFAYSYVSITQTDKRTDYPGKEIAYLVQSKWDKNFSNDIAIVIGDEWHGGNLSYYLSSRPMWFKEKIPKDLDYYGGVIYIGNKNILKEICPGLFGSIWNQGICMIGSK